MDIRSFHSIDRCTYRSEVAIDQMVSGSSIGMFREVVCNYRMRFSIVSMSTDIGFDRWLAAMNVPKDSHQVTKTESIVKCAKSHTEQS